MPLTTDCIAIAVEQGAGQREWATVGYSRETKPAAEKRCRCSSGQKRRLLRRFGDNQRSARESRHEAFRHNVARRRGPVDCAQCPVAPVPLLPVAGLGPGPALPVSGDTPAEPVARSWVWVPLAGAFESGVASVGSPAPGPVVSGSGLVPLPLASAAGGVEPPQASSDRLQARASAKAMGRVMYGVGADFMPRTTTAAKSR